MNIVKRVVNPAGQAKVFLLLYQIFCIMPASQAKVSKSKSKSAPILIYSEPKVVEKWISDIEELHRNQPPPTIQYSKPMPDIDQLMQVSKKSPKITNDMDV